MKTRFCSLLLFLLLPLLLSASGLTGLRVEYTEKPLGIDCAAPRFSWQMQSSESGARQVAYQLQVRNDKGEMVWNSGRCKQEESVNIRYKGASLEPCTRYSWTLTVWDAKKQKLEATSWFETGLMNPDPAAKQWKGAEWIGCPETDRVLYSDYLPVFRLSVTIQLARGSQRAGLLYGVDDPRLMDRNQNVQGIQSAKDSSYVYVELDAGDASKKQPACLRIYRAGYAASDRPDVPLKVFPLRPDYFTPESLKHTLFISSVLGDTRFYIDGEDDAHLTGSLNLNPLGRGGDFVAFPVLAKVGYKVPPGQSADLSAFTIRNYRSPGSILYQDRSAGVSLHGAGKGLEKTFKPDEKSVPMLRTTFRTPHRNVLRARLYATARGIYELYLNGVRVGTDYFAPGASQYDQTQFYQTYDVTSLIKPGENAWGAMLGEGWWSGGITYMGNYWNFFGDRQSLKAKLVITYDNGEQQTLVTNPDSWKYFNNGPVQYSGFFQGEAYDAGREKLINGWNIAGYNDNSWLKACVLPLEKEVAHPDSLQSEQPLPGDFSRQRLIGQYDGGVQQVQELKAVSVEEVRPGVFLYDMGQNFAGIPEIHLENQPAGQAILLRFAEVRYPDMPAYKGHENTIMLENIRAAMAQIRYTTKGETETIRPHFTFFGYRFVEISGIQKALLPEAVRGLVLSSMTQEASSFSCSDSLVNKLWENISWSARSNFLSVPTDCPQRNERLGWSGDISVFSKTASYLSLMPQFLRKHMQAMRDVQGSNGRFPDVAPLGVGFGETMWGSAGITVPWQSYLQYGDLDVLSEHYQAMRKYIEYLWADINPLTGVFKEKEQNTWGSLGDWLSLEDSRNQKLLFWESYLIYDLEIMTRVAALLGKTEDEALFASRSAERKVFFNKTYLEPATGITAYKGKRIDTQTSYVLPLAFGIPCDSIRDRVLNNLSQTITRSNRTDQGRNCPPFSLMTGFIGTAWINSALSDGGRTDLAYNLLMQREYPSWLYPVTQGATTIWERLNSYTNEDGFGGNNNMNSFNHYAFGAVGAWLCDRVLGIYRDETSPAFRHFILQPEPDPNRRMTHAEGGYESLYGRIESSWRIQGDTVHYRWVVPANASATLLLNAHASDKIRSYNKPFAKLKGVKQLNTAGGKIRYELTPGCYEVDVTP